MTQLKYISGNLLIFNDLFISDVFFFSKNNFVSISVNLYRAENLIPSFYSSISPLPSPLPSLPLFEKPLQYQDVRSVCGKPERIPWLGHT